MSWVAVAAAWLAGVAPVACGGSVRVESSPDGTGAPGSVGGAFDGIAGAASNGGGAINTGAGGAAFGGAAFGGAAQHAGAPGIAGSGGALAGAPGDAGTGGEAGSGAPPRFQWVGTWSTTPEPGALTFSKQTIRQFVHLSVGGERVRLHFSNAYGTSPLVVSNVHVAQLAEGIWADLSTDQLVKFRGNGTLTVPTAGSAISDSIEIPVPTVSDLVVSFYVEKTSGPATQHEFGGRFNYIVDGDAGLVMDWRTGQSTASFFYLSGVDVESREALGSIVIIGGSLTDGVSVPVDDFGNSLSDQLARRLRDNDEPIGVLNQGSAGNFLRLNGVLPRKPYAPFGPSVRTRLKRDALDQTGVRWVIGTDSPMHELARPNLDTSGELLIQALQQVIAGVHQEGLSFLCMTIPPFEGHPTWSTEGEQYRIEYNAFVRSTGSGCEGILDVDRVLQDPADQLRMSAEYDSGDHWLPNDGGIRQIAMSLDLDLLK